MQRILLQIRYLERELSKSFKKINFVFLLNRISSVCHWYVIWMSLVCTVCHLYVLVCHPYVTLMYSYIIRMSLVCHPCVTRMYSYVIRMSLVCGFAMNPKGVYRKFRRTKINVENLRSKDEVELFWKSIWCINVAFNKQAPWINDLVLNYCIDANQNVYSIDLKTTNTVWNWHK